MYSTEERNLAIFSLFLLGIILLSFSLMLKADMLPTFGNATSEPKKETELIFPDGYEILGVSDYSEYRQKFTCKRPDNKIVRCNPIEERQIEKYNE